MTSPTTDIEQPGDDIAKSAFDHVDPTIDQAVPSPKKSGNFNAVLAGGLGMLSDGYQNSLLSTSNVLFKKIYGSEYSNTYAGQIANALLVGIILGEFAMGFVTDRIGRKAAVFTTTGILILGSVLGTVAHAPTPVGLFWFLTVARGITGFGSGGEYPAAQTVSVEGADANYALKRRGAVFILSTIGSLLCGQLLTYAVCLLGLSASGYNNITAADQLNKLGIVWRVEWAVGALLPMCVLAFRYRALASGLYKTNSIRKNVPYWLFVKKYWPRLLGSTGSFFFSQFVGYPGGTFGGIIIAGLSPNGTMVNTIAYSMLLAAFNIPGLLLGAWCTGFMDRRYQLALGFGGQVLLGCLIGGFYDRIVTILPLFIVLYGVYLSIGGFGPGNLNGLLVSEAYPTSMRGTAHGIVAALGKVGGVCGTFAFTQVAASLGVRYTFIVGGSIATIGIFCGLFLTPNTLVMSLEQVDEEWRLYLLEKNWQGSFGENSDKKPVDFDRPKVTVIDQIHHPVTRPASLL